MAYCEYCDHNAILESYGLWAVEIEGLRRVSEKLERLVGEMRQDLTNAGELDTEQSNGYLKTSVMIYISKVQEVIREIEQL